MKLLLILLSFCFSISVIQATPIYPLKIFSPKIEKAVDMQAPDVAFISVAPGLNQGTATIEAYVISERRILYPGVNSSFNTGLKGLQPYKYLSEGNRPLKRLILPDKREQIFYKGRSNTSDG